MTYCDEGLFRHIQDSRGRRLSTRNLGDGLDRVDHGLVGHTVLRRQARNGLSLVVVAEKARLLVHHFAQESTAQNPSGRSLRELAAQPACHLFQGPPFLVRLHREGGPDVGAGSNRPDDVDAISEAVSSVRYERVDDLSGKVMSP